MPAVFATPLEQVDPSQIVLSKTQTMAWNFVDSKTGIHRKGSHKFVHVLQGDAPVGLSEQNLGFAFILKDVKAVGGIRETDKPKKGHLQVELSRAQVVDIQTRIETALAELIFLNREHFFTPEVLQKFQTIDDVGSALSLMVDATALQLQVGMRKLVGIRTVDLTECELSDEDGMPFDWHLIDDKRIDELVVEIDRIVFNSRIRVFLTARSILINKPEETDEPHETPKAEASDESKHSEESEEDSADSEGEKDTPQQSQAFQSLQKSERGGRHNIQLSLLALVGVIGFLFWLACHCSESNSEL